MDIIEIERKRLLHLFIVLRHAAQQMTETLKGLFPLFFFKKVFNGIKFETLMVI